MRLTYADWDALLRPEVGGALASLRLRGVDVLRPMADGAETPTLSSGFALAPYCNRIREGRFSFREREVTMPANHPPEPHSLHGLSWQRAWQVAEQTERRIVLRDEYDGSGPWPWAYRLDQSVELAPDACTILLTLTSLADEPAPAGLGFHPYFRRRPATQVRFEAQGVMLVSEDLLPTGEIAEANHFAPWSEGAPLPDTLVDNCHVGWTGEAEVEDDLGRVRLTAEGGPHLHIYAPPGKPILCLEPVSHLPNVINSRDGGMAVLAPGETLKMQLRIEEDRKPV